MIKRINWNEIPTENVTKTMQRQLVYGDRIMIGRMKFKDGFTAELHHHESEQITQVLSGKVHFWIGKDMKEQFELSEGDVCVIPSNVPHKALMIGDVELIDTWSPVREDWLDGTDDYLKK